MGVENHAIHDILVKIAEDLMHKMVTVAHKMY